MCKWAIALRQHAFALEDVPNPERCIATSSFGVALWGIMVYIVYSHSGGSSDAKEADHYLLFRLAAALKATKVP